MLWRYSYYIMIPKVKYVSGKEMIRLIRRRCFILGIILTGIFCAASGQDRHSPSLLAAIHDIMDHPFKKKNEITVPRIMLKLKPVIPMEAGDQRFISWTKELVNPSMSGVFSDYYFLGKAFWMLSHKSFANADGAKLAGIRAVIHLYKKMKTYNPVFEIPYMTSFVEMEQKGQLQGYVMDYMHREVNPEKRGCIDPGLTVELEGVSTASTYGYVPSNPIKTGRHVFREKEYLRFLSGAHGERFSYKLIHTGYGADLYRKVTGPAALLDEYEIRIEGEKPVILYFDAYRQDMLYCPNGLISGS